jgi:hypothetical protein
MTLFYARAALAPYVAAAFLVACGDSDHPPPPPIGQSGEGPVVPPIVEIGGRSSAGTTGQGGTSPGLGGTSSIAGLEPGGSAGFAEAGSGGSLAGTGSALGGVGGDSTVAGTFSASGTFSSGGI